MFLTKIEYAAYHGHCENLEHINSDTISSLSIDELSVLHKIILGPHVGLAIALLQRIGFFVDLIPEIQDSLDLKHSKQFKEIWPHTLQVLNQTPININVRWAALFHDLGKAKAFSIKNNKVTFHHHEHISAVIFDRFAKKVRIFSDGQRRAIRFLIANLGYVESYNSDWTDSAVRRFDKEVNIFLDDLLLLSESDITTSKPENKRRILRRIQELRNRIIDIREKDAKACLLPKGLGSTINEQLGIPLGPKIGEIRTYLETKINANELLANQDIAYYIDHLKNNMVENGNNSE